MITREQTKKVFEAEFPYMNGDALAWHYFKMFYELGWNNCEKHISNPFPIPKEVTELYINIPDPKDFI